MNDFLSIKLFLLIVCADFCFGDALFRNFHPVVWIGSLITRLETLIFPVDENRKKEFYAGLFLTVVVVLISFIVVKVGLLVSLSFGVIVYYYKENHSSVHFVECTNVDNLHCGLDHLVPQGTSQYN